VLNHYSPAQLEHPQEFPTTTLPAKPLPITAQAKVLGMVGEHPILPEILEALLPENNPEVLSREQVTPFQLPPLYDYSPEMQTFLHTLPPHVLQQIPSKDFPQCTPLYHAAAYLIPKPASQKVSLILNMKAWNHSQEYKPPPFKLPTVYSLRLRLLKAHLNQVKLFFTTWNIKNFYWTLKGPIVRFATLSATGTPQIWQLNCGPFGWDKACFLGQQSHLNIVNKIPQPQETEAKVYIDDGLGSGPSTTELNQYTAQVVAGQADAGFPISEKSHLEAAEQQTYIGTLYSQDGIANTDDRLTKLLLLFAIVSCCPYLSSSYLEKLLGLSIYAVCHNQGYSHTAYLRWLMTQRKYTSVTPCLRSTLVSVWATAATPWTFQGSFPMQQPGSPVIYADAGPNLVGLVYRHTNQRWYSVVLSTTPLSGDPR